MQKHYIYTFCLWLCCWATQATAQGWQKEYSLSNNAENGFSVIPTKDAGYITAGYADIGGSRKIYIVKTDINGELLWSSLYGSGASQQAYSIQETTNGYIFCGYTDTYGDYDVMLVNIDLNGDTLWTKTYQHSGNDEGHAIRQTTDGGYIIAGSLSEIGVRYPYLIKTNANGDTLWTRQYIGTAIYSDGYAVQQTLDGGYMMFATGKLIKIDGLGNVEWEYTNPTYVPTMDIVSGVYGAADALKQLADSSYIVCGAGGNNDAMLTKIKANGTWDWTKYYGGFNIDKAYGVWLTHDGGYALCGATNSYSTAGDQDLYLVKTDALGNQLWFRNYGILAGVGQAGADVAHSIVQTADQGYILCGRSYNNANGNNNLYLVKTDSLGNSYANVLEGLVYVDDNTNCLFESNEQTLGGIVIKATEINNGQIQYGTTDKDGKYTLASDTGTYTLEAYTNAYYSNLCSSNTVQISNSKGLDTFDIALQTMVQACPFLTVDISTPILRPTAGGSFYTVQYCNYGTADALNAYVEIDFDPNLNVLGSSVPIISQNGNLYTFDIDTVAIGQCSSFQVQVVVDSSATIGQTHCTQAHIYPDSVCIPNLWLGPTISATAECNNDTIFFMIQNKGSNMSATTNYFVYEDHVMLRTGSTQQLNNGQTEIIKQPAAQGKTYRIEVLQLSGYPAILGDSIVSATVEGCNRYSNGGFNTGYVTQFSNGNSSPFIAIDCQQSVAAWDPNDKQAQPKGYEAPHYIYDYTQLDYHVRFQNTGSDTAFRVVIRDPLSLHLDPSSIQMGASSHPYTWRIYGDGILEVTFDNIMLPDSNVNEPASHGFIKFRIDQATNNPLGTVINNQASIYFDYNPAILTNTTFHTIGDNFVTVILTDVEEAEKEEEVAIKVIPNPFQTEATIKVEGKDYQNLELKVYDTMGRQVVQSSSTNNQFQVYKKDLSTGIFIFQVLSDGQLLRAGKIIVR
ncbi:MAG: T9SS type A sorting domain-containing protein [Aureispira sp.]|nr:T9SS type A sorting domain-containing protein [Aureispira sp.]